MGADSFLLLCPALIVTAKVDSPALKLAKSKNGWTPTTREQGMSALRDGGMVQLTVQGAATNTSGIRYVPLVRHWLPLRRLWFVASCIPRYLITGSVEVP